MSNIKRDNAILRLRKLMGAKTWGSEEEMKTAMALSQKIMRQYNISMSDVEHAEINCVRKSANGGKKKKRRNFMDMLAWRIARHSETKFWRHHDFVGKTGFTYEYFGYPTDVELALYLFDTTKRYIETSTRDYKDTEEYNIELGVYSYQPSVSSRELLHAFKIGCATGVAQVLDDLFDEKTEEITQLQEAVTETGLMIVKDKVIQRDFEKTGISLTKKPGLNSRVSSAGGYFQGIVKGREFKVTTGVGDGGARERLTR